LCTAREFDSVAWGGGFQLTAHVGRPVKAWPWAETVTATAASTAMAANRMLTMVRVMGGYLGG
jgi:hypothetical protein